jgi:hypothetical protein
MRDQRIARGRLVTVIAIGAWFVAACICGVLGIIDSPGRPPIVLGSFIVLPVLGFVAAYLISPSIRAFAASLSLALLVGSHLWRFVGLGFIIAWLKGSLPAGFAIPEGLGDIVAALGALLLLPTLREGRVPRGLLLAWNTWGFLDLVSAIAMGVLYSNSTLGILSRGTVTTRLMVTFPVSLIPTFFVPLFLLLHALTFKRIAHIDAPASETEGIAAR